MSPTEQAIGDSGKEAVLLWPSVLLC